MIVTQHYVFGRNNEQPNTFIGGLGDDIEFNSKSALALKFGISESNIKSFRVVDNEIQAHINTTYSLHNTFNNRDNLTHFKDEANNLITFGNGTFDSCNNLTELKAEGLISFSGGGLQKLSYTKITTLNFPNLLSFSGNISITNNTLLTTVICPNAVSAPNNESLRNNPNLELFDGRKIKSFSNTNPNYRSNGWFSNSGKIGEFVIKVHIDAKTNPLDGGSLDINLLRAFNERQAIIEFYDDNGNYVETY